MSFEELIKWSQSVNWEIVTNEQWNIFDTRCKELAREYFRNKDLCELNEFYRTYAGDNIDPWFDAWAQSMRDCFPISEIYERLDAIENTLGVLLKQFDKEPANITIGQLNRLKRGL